MSAFEGSALQEAAEAAALNPREAAARRVARPFFFELGQRCAWNENGETKTGHWPFRVTVTASTYEEAHAKMNRALQKLVDGA